MKTSDRPLPKMIVEYVQTASFGRLSDRKKMKLLNVMNCRTEVMGVTELRCENPDCDHRKTLYRGCGDRMCATCSHLPREKWNLQRKNDVIPDTVYYQIVFKLPYFFSQIAAQNQKVVQDLMFKAMKKTFKAAMKKFYAKSKMGYMAALHTWSQRLTDHYHLHVAMPGGFMLDGKWIDKRNYFLPIVVLDKLFRAKMCSGIRQLYREGKLVFDGPMAKYFETSVFSKEVDKYYRKSWGADIKKTRNADPTRMIGYLSRYVYNTAISPSRIVKIEDGKVTFTHRDHKSASGRGQTELSIEDFMNRFTGHIQPEGYHRIRYYGFMAGKGKVETLETIFKQKGSTYEAKNEEIHNSSCTEALEMIGTWQIPKCPCCGGRIITLFEYQKNQLSHGPPGDEINGYEYKRSA